MGGPSAPKAVRDMVFRDVTADVQINPLKTGGITNLRKDPEQRWFRTMTATLRDNYKETTGKTVQYGSELEYLMNQYASLLSANDAERSMLGLGGVTDEQIGLTYSLMLGELERDGQGDRIIGSNMKPEDANKLRKHLFDSFYEILNNGNNPKLTDEQEKVKQRWFDKLAIATYGEGASAGNFTSTEVTVHDIDRVYTQPLTTRFYQQVKKYNKGE